MDPYDSAFSLIIRDFGISRGVFLWWSWKGTVYSDVYSQRCKFWSSMLEMPRFAVSHAYFILDRGYLFESRDI